MKTTFCIISFLASFAVSHSQDCAPVNYVENNACYSTPVVYQSAVVYQAPVAYYAPVYYVASAASAACYAACPQQPCSSPSTVIHITGGRGVYVTSNGDYDRCGGSSVVYIGSRYARPSTHSYFYSHRR